MSAPVSIRDQVKVQGKYLMQLYVSAIKARRNGSATNNPSIVVQLEAEILRASREFYSLCSQLPKITVWDFQARKDGVGIAKDALEYATRDGSDIDTMISNLAIARILYVEAIARSPSRDGSTSQFPIWPV